MTTTQVARPEWYTDEDDTAWERVKAAFRRDWTQTKHDLGGKSPDLNQQVGDTVSQAAGSEAIPPGNVRNPSKVKNEGDVYRESDEPAYRYGFAAYRQFGNLCEWSPETEDALRREFGPEWEEKRNAVRRGWFYSKNQCGKHCE